MGKSKPVTARVVLLTCILSCILSCRAQNFIGVWSDLREAGGYGGDLHICQSGKDFFGAYSEAGILVGNVNNVTASGKWFEGGSEDADYDCYFGEFFFVLSEDGSAFSGYWKCDGKNTEYEWSSQRKSVLSPTIYECAQLYPSTKASFDGVWIERNSNSNNDYRAICTDDSTYECSYQYENGDSNIEGFDEGEVYYSIIATGYTEEERKEGISLQFILADGSLGQFWWFAYRGKPLDYDHVDDDDKHTYRIFDRQSQADLQDCQKYDNVRYLERGYYYDDDDATGTGDSGGSSASTVTYSLGVILLCYFFATL